jgi:hypothetical protein
VSFVASLSKCRKYKKNYLPNDFFSRDDDFKFTNNSKNCFFFTICPVRIPKGPEFYTDFENINLSGQLTTEGSHQAWFCTSPRHLTCGECEHSCLHRTLPGGWEEALGQIWRPKTSRTLVSATTSYRDVLLRRRFLPETLCYRRRYVTKTFCYGDVLYGDVLSRRFVWRRFVCTVRQEKCQNHMFILNYFLRCILLL